MAAPYRISIGVNVDASGAKAGSGVARQAVAAIGAEADKAAPKIERAAESIRKLESAGGTGAAAASIDAVRAAAAAAAPSMERLVNAFAGITAPAANDNGRADDIAAYGAELDRLRAKLDPVFAAQQAYRQKLDEINQAERVGAITASAAIDIRIREAAAYEALISKVERLGLARKAAAQQIVDRQTITPDRGADVEAYGRSLDQLRARYNPLYAAIIQYKQAQVEIRNAHAVGAISADEMTAALARQRQMALASIDAIKGRNAALRATPAAANRFATANIAAQFQDIGVTAAMGMSPLQIALQQGTQLAAVFSTMDKPVQGLAAALRSVIGLQSLLTIGAVAAGAAVIQYFGSILTEGEKSTETLERQADLVMELAKRWGDVVPALRDYADEVARARGAAELQEGLTILKDRDLAGIRTAVESAQVGIAALVQDLQAAGEETGSILALQEALNRFSEAAADGEVSAADVERVTGALSAVVNGSGIPAIADFANSFRALAADALAAADKVQEAARAAKQAQAIMSDPKTWRSFNRTDQFGADATIQSDGIVLPDVGPRIENRPRIELEGLPGADRLARSAARATDAYKTLIESAGDRIEQMRLEAELAGVVGVEADTLRFRLDLLRKAEDDNGKVSEKRRAEIEKLAAAYRDQAEATAIAKLQADLLWEREQMGRTWMEQQIAARLRSAGKGVDFDSYEAGIIRTQIALQVARDYAGDFVETLFDGLDQGKSLWDSFADAGIAALKRLGRSLLEDVLNNLFKVQSAAGGGSGGLFGGGSLFGSILGGLFSPQYRIASSGGIGLYDRGGYTGPGGIHEPRGVVHAGEVVWSQDDVARAGGVASVEAMRLGLAGYARGGAVGVQPMLPAGRAIDRAAAPGAGGVSRLKIELGLAADGGLNIRPQVEGVVQEVAPGIAIDVVEQNNRGEADRIAAYNRNPRWR